MRLIVRAAVVDYRVFERGRMNDLHEYNVMVLSHLAALVVGSKKIGL